MKMSMKLRDDVLALMEEYIRQEGGKGNSLSETRVSREATGYGDFVGTLRKWDGGKPGPSMVTVAKFEAYLAEQVGPDFYKSFMERRAAMVAADGGF
jgi:hypothetical protein